MSRIQLTAKAESDLGAIFEFYSNLMGEKGAREVIDTLLSKLWDLQAFPSMGRPSQVSGVRELVYIQYPFVAPYRYVHPHDRIEVLRFLHQSSERPQDW
ncbi:type II toxin-antitoxin system RelE/ParE family toxin [Pseudomonas solani]|uniref:type II toxin-antitoxin system RelE/ParE family toxin n=1 Tax=Pseudomonas solani TaxID=2731552 RepID=UPI003C2E30AA